MSLPGLFACLFTRRKNHPVRKSTRTPSRTQLRLELLENRWVPSTITVNPGQTIQSAINAATSGATITVNPGTYTEQLTISKNVRLQANGAVTLLAPANTAVNALVEITGQNVTLTGFNLDGNASQSTLGSAVSIDGSGSASILNSHIHDIATLAGQQAGIGINVNTTGTVKIMNDAIDSYFADGIRVLDTASIKIANNVITGAGASSAVSQVVSQNGIQIGAYAGDPSSYPAYITGNLITGNIYTNSSNESLVAADNLENDYEADAILVGTQGHVTVVGNDFTGNQDGVQLNSASNVIIGNNYLANNTADGVLLFSTAGSPACTNNEVEFNLVLNNGRNGIQLYGTDSNGAGTSSTNNNVINCNVCAFQTNGSLNYTSGSGILLRGSDSNCITGNAAVINIYGIVLTTNGEAQASVNNTVSGNIAVLNCVNVVNDSNTNHFYSNDFGSGWGNSGGYSGTDEQDNYSCGGGLNEC